MKIDDFSDLEDNYGNLGGKSEAEKEREFLKSEDDSEAVLKEYGLNRYDDLRCPYYGCDTVATED